MNRFLSFADSRMSAALERLGRQAEALDFFDEITLFTEHDLSAEFTSRMGRYLTPSCRGFGYIRAHLPLSLTRKRRLIHSAPFQPFSPHENA